MLRVLADEVQAGGPWGLAIAFILTVPATIAAIVAASRAGKAKRNTQPNGGTSSYDALFKGQEYAIGLIHGLAEETREHFKEVAGKTENAVVAANRAQAAVKQTDVQLAAIRQMTESNRDRIEALEQYAQGNPQGTA